MLYKAAIAILLLSLTPTLAFGQERDLCADRPGLGTPACTVDKGHVVLEMGLGNWTHDRDGQVVTDTFQTGDALIRLGLTDSLEAQVGWTAYGTTRIRDRATGLVDRQSSTGDVSLALRQNLHNPDGSGFTIAVMPYVSVPTGGSAIGAGDWGAGLLVPVGFDLGNHLSVALTQEIDASVDQDGNGRHLAYGSVVGLDYAFTDAITGTIETSLMRDDDPDGHVTQALGGLSFAWQPSRAMQWDIGLNVGLNHNSPDRQVYLGVVRRF
ncbi:transporter [Sphingobium sp.]|uniref:transporter n=1 Tax=Sphingobium sp. TaxID=1912891 RepID=UPI003BB4E220